MEINPENKTPRSFNKNQKITAVVFGFLALAIVTAMIMQMRYQITSPFSAPKSSSVAANQAATLSETGSGTSAELKGKDTDKDGISDFDELEVYKTSPYMEDSDSDGFLDREEVTNGTDPNCPSGQTCIVATPIATPVDMATIDPTAILATTTATIDPNEALYNNITSGASDPAVLRKLLLDNGMEAAALDQITDEELLADYNSVLMQ
jgi:hypothetical protein